MSDEITLEDAIRDMLGTEEEPVEDDETTEEGEETEGSEESGAGDDEPTEQNEEDSETDETEEVESKLAELEAQYGKADEEDPWQPIKAEEQVLLQEQAELQQSFLTGLPDIKNDAGKTIYEMDEKAFDDFLQQLDDDGKERLKVNAIQARETAVQKALAYQERKVNFEARLQVYHQSKLEMDVITDIAKQLNLPEVVKKYKEGEFHKFAREKAKSDPSIAQKASSKEGLYQLAIMAIRDLQLVKSKESETKKPSAPDAKAASKKVKSTPSDNSTEALLAKVSKDPSEYKKLDRKTRDRLMYASIRDVL
jgi:hypothetical protein